MLNPGERKLQGSKTSSQSRHMYNMGKNNCQFFIFGGGGLGGTYVEPR